MADHDTHDHTGITGVGVGDATAHIADATDAHDASSISFSPTGTIAATDVQAAIAEVASEAAAGGIPATIVDAKGDAIVATAADTVARLAVGSNGSHVVADSTTASGWRWVAVPQYATVTTGESTTTTSYTDLATGGPAVTVVINTAVKITISCSMYGSANGCAQFMSVALSSANTVAADDAKALVYYSFDTSASDMRASRVVYLSGLTPGSTVFTSKYKHGVTGTSTFRDRQILVECMD